MENVKVVIAAFIICGFESKQKYDLQFPENVTLHNLLPRIVFEKLMFNTCMNIAILSKNTHKTNSPNIKWQHAIRDFLQFFYFDFFNYAIENV